MIIKTEHFDNTFKKDILELTINKNFPIKIKGSYKIFDAIDRIYLTDIDMECNVKYNQYFINTMIDKIERSKSFIFIQLSLGMKKEFILPWKIDNDGGCNYDPETVKTWYTTFKNMNAVPKKVYDYIENKLFSDTISISYLIDVENELSDYSKLLWSLDDIKKGYISWLDTKYFLLDMITIEFPVFEFMYKYKDDFCLIDLAVIDRKYEYEFEHNMYKYYIQDSYKIMKSFRWRIKKNYFEEYNHIMKGINLLSAIYNKIILFEKVYKYKLLSEKYFLNIQNDIMRHLQKLDINDFNINTKVIIKNKIEIYLKNYINYFKDKLTPKYIDVVSREYHRSLEAQVLTTQYILNKRVKNNIKCPFFPMDIKEYKKIFKIINTLKLDLNSTIDCFIKIAEETGKTIEELLEITDDILLEKEIQI